MEDEKFGTDFEFEVDGEVREVKGPQSEILKLDDEIDLEKFTYRQEIASTIKGQITFIPVRRPHPQSWIYISPQAEWRGHVALLEIPETRENYLISPAIVASLNGEVGLRYLVPYMDREGGIFLWALKLADSRGNFSSWATSAFRICQEFSGKWIKVKARQSSGSYDVVEAPKPLPPPEWPDGCNLKYLLNFIFLLIRKTGLKVLM